MLLNNDTDFNRNTFQPLLQRVILNYQKKLSKKSDCSIALHPLTAESWHAENATY